MTYKEKFVKKLLQLVDYNIVNKRSQSILKHGISSYMMEILYNIVLRVKVSLEIVEVSLEHR